MVLIHIKNSDENQFLFETTTKDSVDKLVRELVCLFLSFFPNSSANFFTHRRFHRSTYGTRESRSGSLFISANASESLDPQRHQKNKVWMRFWKRQERLSVRRRRETHSTKQILWGKELEMRVIQNCLAC